MLAIPGEARAWWLAAQQRLGGACRSACRWPKSVRYRDGPKFAVAWPNPIDQRSPYASARLTAKGSSRRLVGNHRWQQVMVAGLAGRRNV
jgi:hypothetical protein